jgi:hypothetical protein
VEHGERRSREERLTLLVQFSRRTILEESFVLFCQPCSSI